MDQGERRRSATIVHDENGTHLDGYSHMDVAIDASGRDGLVRRHHPHREGEG